MTPGATEDRRAEEPRRHGEIWMRAVLDTALGAIVGIDAAGRITTWNLGAETTFGWTRNEALGLGLTDTIIPERHREAHRSGLARVLAADAEQTLNRRIETSALRRNGEEFPVELAITQFKVEDGRHFIAFISDISERVKAQTQIREMNDRLRAIIDASADAIISVDADERVVVFNIAAEKLFQLPAAEALGQNLDRFIPTRFRGSHRVHLRKFGQHGATMRTMGQFARLTALRADGTEFPIEAAISRARAGGKDLFTVTIRDITQRREAEAAQASL